MTINILLSWYEASLLCFYVHCKEPKVEFFYYFMNLSKWKVVDVFNESIFVGNLIVHISNEFLADIAIYVYNHVS